MKINCLSCGFQVDLDDDVYPDYEGQIMCYACNGLLLIRTVDGKLKSVKLVDSIGTLMGDKTTKRAGTVAH